MSSHTYTFTCGTMDQDHNFTPDPSAETKDIDASDEYEAYERMSIYLEDFEKEPGQFWAITNVCPKEED